MEEGRSRGRRAALGRAGLQLGQTMGEVLTGGLSALQRSGWLPPALAHQPTASAATSVARMREVLERDRALAESSLEHSEPARARDELVAEAPRATSPTPVLHAAAVQDTVLTPKPALPQKPPPCTEPIRTRTMAKLLRAQGHPQRALSIYEALIREGQRDPALLAEAEELRRLQT